MLRAELQVQPGIRQVTQDGARGGVFARAAAIEQGVADHVAAHEDCVKDILPGFRALVVDVRDNPGGNYVLAAAIAGRFADRSRTFGYIRRRNGPHHDDFTGYIGETVEPSGVHFGGRTFVLTNRRSFSSAEDFVLAMRSITGVMVVGDTTGGATGGTPIEIRP